MPSAPLQLAAVIARTTGKRALYLALPLYFVVGIVAFILFAGNGMDASYVTKLSLESHAGRFSLLLGWGMLTLPVARLLVGDPETFFLRVLPVPRWWLLAVTFAGLALLQLAWLVLWLRGAGPLAGACALFAVLGLQCHAIAGVRGVASLIGVLAVAGGWALAPSPLSLVLSVPAALHGYRQAWLQAPEPRAAGQHRVSSANAWLAAATAFGVSAYRSNGSAAARALTLALLSYAGIALGLRHNPEWSPRALAQVTLALWGAACLLGGVTLARPVLQAERELTEVLDACGTPLSLRALSGAGLLAALGAVAGGALGLLLAGSSPAGAGFASPTAQLSLTGAAWAALGMALVRILTRGSGRDSGRQLLAQLGLYVAAMALLLLGPALMTVFLLAAAAVAVAYAARFAARGAPTTLRGA